MDRPIAKLMPVFLTASVIAILLLLKWILAFVPGLNLMERAELFTFDWRARIALAGWPPIATNLAAIYVDDHSITELNSRLGKIDWSWPRSVYGRVIRELKAQGATVVGIDGFLISPEHRPPEAELGGLTPDEFLAQEMASAGNVVIPTTSADINVRPARVEPILDLFATNAWRLGQDGLIGLSHANSDRLRSVTAFHRDPETGRPLWQMGILMAARELKLDLEHPEFNRDSIVLRRQGGGASLRLPVHANGQFYIDWAITQGNRPGLEFPFSAFYEDSLRRARGESVDSVVTNRLVLIGFTLGGGRADDSRATPVSDSMPACLAHLNIVNSILTGRFIVRASPSVELLLIAGMAILSAGVGWRLRVGWGLAAFFVVVAGYLLVAVKLYITQRYWLPVAAPLGGAFAMGYVCLLSYRAIVERQHHRYFRSVLGRVLSPNIFSLLVRQPASALDTCRRNVTIYFADVRGFTRYMEDHHVRALKRLAGQDLKSESAEAIIAQDVGESLETINKCLGEIADVVKVHEGTLDKYIGDCVMSFWGAPVADERHAVKAVRGAVAVHRALHALNLEGVVENERRQKENIQRLQAGLPELEPLAVLRVGSALNSGMVTVGFMGSMAHVSNYTVFGREVNIASRLESLAEPDCILVTEATVNEVRRHDPALAATFIKRDSVNLHGIARPVQIYEVPWQVTGTHSRRSTEAPPASLNLPHL